MTTIDLHHRQTLIGYNGGSAGDFYAASLNGIDISQTQSNRINGHTLGFSIKHLDLRHRHEWITLLQSMPWRFVTTHRDLRNDMDLPVNRINIVITDERVAEICLLRQMMLQHLVIEVDWQSDWYRVVKSLCDRSRFEAAAAFWLKHSRLLWNQQMQQRLTYNAAHQVNFNHLFDHRFVDSVWIGDWPEVTTNNHRHWLARNQPQGFSESLTISSMAAKLSSMPWQHKQGIIRYEP